jgi:hypothetical protein
MGQHSNIDSVQTPADCHRLLIAVWNRLQELDADWPVIARATSCQIFAIDEILPARNGSE